MLAIKYLNVKLAYYPFIMNVLDVDILFKTIEFIINPNYFENMARLSALSTRYSAPDTRHSALKEA